MQVNGEQVALDKPMSVTEYLKARGLRAERGTARSFRVTNVMRRCSTTSASWKSCNSCREAERPAFRSEECERSVVLAGGVGLASHMQSQPVFRPFFP